ncbi:hypothetical protein [Devosia psychrophila]|jgi:hypothetical protein|uniref:Lipopolysaccharide export system protein LptC n=1 Tax=Devosia psychrophila TaxID=728005 RepID=A0A0F5Q0P2_9HYPH|nr:hypothetical protein [Devosia psychrophila]KKC34468.1 hypothetical protein WH91_02835 [Devosia psychrophila]SFD03946.1 hypothetical protein SAMN04488059_11851 [Devosia psychrophila]
MNLHADAAQRLKIYQGLQARNRVVAVLRLGVPAMGAVALALLVGQIYLSSLGSRFGVGKITVTRESVSVDAPQYAGLLDDGTAYRVSATSAQAATGATDQIALTHSRLVMTRPTGVATTVEAEAALLDTTRELVVIKDIAHVSTSEGTKGVVADSIFDYKTQSLVGQGPVTIDYADGTHLVAEGLTYNAITMIWTFTRSTVTLPDTPGADPEAADPEAAKTTEMTVP